MSELSSSEKVNEDFLNIIGLFKQMCLYYKDKNELFNLETFNGLFQKLYVILNKSKLFKNLIKEGWHDLVLEIMHISFERNDLDCLSIVFGNMVNITDKSKFVCRELVKADMGNLLIKMYLKFNDNKINNNKYILIDVLTLIHNIARHAELQQYFLSNENIAQFKETIRNLLVDSDDKLRMLSTFVLTWFAKEDEENKKFIGDHSDIINTILQCIDKALLSQERTYMGWSIWELLLGLQALSTIDSIKCKIMNTGVILTIIKVIKTSTLVHKEVEISIGIVWNLSFIEENRKVLKKDFQIEQIVQPFIKAESKSVRHIAKGIIWFLNKENDGNIDTKTLKYDIFLSYSHAENDVVSQIEARLKKNYTVWIDKDNVKGSCLDDMASGIERSRVFVMCLSNSYKQSQYCRSEASYAYRQKRTIIPLLMERKFKPDGWLGMITSSETYVDFSELSKLNESITKLRSVLEYKIKQYTKKPLIKKDSVRKLSDQPKGITDWNINQVKQWLLSNDLSDIQPKFQEFDGEMIDALMKLKIETPDIYYKSLEKKLKLTFPEILKFNTALSKLNK